MAKKSKLTPKQKEIKEWMENYKDNLECEECGENHPACLDFHHEEPKDKIYSISTMVSQGMDIKDIQEELSKCIVLCSNCHRKLHWFEKEAKTSW